MSFLELFDLSEILPSKLISNEFTFGYAGFTIVAEEMLFLIIVYTAVVIVWTIEIEQSIHAIKLCPVTKWRK